MSFNSHVIEFLNYYVNLDTPPNYAVLLRGEWGSGKTWFIKEYIKQKREKRQNKFIYVSLYGLTSFDDIEQAFYKELHPVLASEEFKLAKAIFKGLVKTAIKVDLDSDGDGKNDVSLTGVLPDVQLLKSLKENKDCTLVFDDLERSSILLSPLLGYINQLVENNDIKVILLANETELDKAVGSDNDTVNLYRSIKEKLIGKTFLIKSNVFSAVNFFIDHLENTDVKKLLKEKIEVIINVFNDADYHNLRHLRQGILDFERLYTFLPEESLKKEKLINEIIKIFFALNFELKKGYITEKDIIKIKSNLYLMTRQKDEKDPIINIYNKYGLFGRDNPLSSELWSEFFTNSILNKEDVKTELLNGPYFSDENTPDWIVLSSFSVLEENEFNEKISSVLESLNKFNFKSKNDLASVVNIMLFFSENNIIELSKSRILEIARDNIKFLKESGLINLNYDENFYLNKNRFVNNLGTDIEEFKIFVQELREASESTKMSSLLSASQSLLENLTSSFDIFDKRLNSRYSGGGDLISVPVLGYIDIDKFTNSFWKLPQQNKISLGSSFIHRYQDVDNNITLRSELVWLKELYHIISDQNSSNENKLTKYVIKNIFLPNLNEAISKLESSIQEFI